jgi:nitroreductase
MLSNLLWSACGVNRKKGPFGGPGITSASASNSKEIDLYVATEKGVYRYDPAAHGMVPVVAGDLRAMGIGQGQGKAGAEAPVRLIYVVDIDKFSKAGFQEPGLWDRETQKSYYYVDTGLIAGNVYLFAASQGLAAWFHNCNKAELAARLGLTKDQRVLFGQTIGYPE